MYLWRRIGSPQGDECRQTETEENRGRDPPPPRVRQTATPWKTWASGTLLGTMPRCSPLRVRTPSERNDEVDDDNDVVITISSSYWR